MQTAVGAVDIERDQALFIEYNVRQFEEPQDWTWEPCVGYYDTVCCTYDHIWDERGRVKARAFLVLTLHDLGRNGH